MNQYFDLLLWQIVSRLEYVEVQYNCCIPSVSTPDQYYVKTWYWSIFMSVAFQQNTSVIVHHFKKNAKKKKNKNERK